MRCFARGSANRRSRSSFATTPFACFAMLPRGTSTDHRSRASTTRMTRAWPHRSPALFGISFLLALLLYLPRTCRTLAAFADSAELVTAAAVWGVPHPPGYPLYSALAHLFTYLP